jgi:hypothetical protein
MEAEFGVGLKEYEVFLLAALLRNLREIEGLKGCLIELERNV